MERKIAFERVKRVMLENVHRIVRSRVRPSDCTVLMIKLYLADGSTVMRTDRDIMRRAIPDAMRAFIDGCDVRRADELIGLLPRGADNRIPGWVYDGVSAYMDPDTGEWMLEPRGAA